MPCKSSYSGCGSFADWDDHCCGGYRHDVPRVYDDGYTQLEKICWLENNYRCLASAFYTLTDDVEALKTDVEGIHGEIALIQDHIAIIDGEISDHSNLIAQNTQDIERLDQAINDLTVEVDDNKAAIEERVKYTDCKSTVDPSSNPVMTMTDVMDVVNSNNFRGSFPTYADLAQETSNPGDYAIVEADETHGGVRARYLDDGAGGWLFEYVIGDTTTDVIINKSNVSGPTATDALNALLERADSLDQDTYDLAQILGDMRRLNNYQKYYIFNLNVETLGNNLPISINFNPRRDGSQFNLTILPTGNIRSLINQIDTNYDCSASTLQLWVEFDHDDLTATENPTLKISYTFKFSMALKSGFAAWNILAATSPSGTMTFELRFVSSYENPIFKPNSRFGETTTLERGLLSTGDSRVNDLITWAAIGYGAYQNSVTYHRAYLLNHTGSNVTFNDIQYFTMKGEVYYGYTDDQRN